MNILINIIWFFGVVYSSDDIFEHLFDVHIGDSKGQIEVYSEDPATYFAVDDSGNIWLDNIVSRKINAYNNKGRFLYEIDYYHSFNSIRGMHIYDKYLIVFSIEGRLNFYDKANGIELFYKSFPANVNPYGCKHFFSNKVYIPLGSNSSPTEFEFLINKSDKLTSEDIKIIQTDYKSISYSTTEFPQFLPIDSISSYYLNELHTLDFKGQSEDYILFSKERESKGEEYFIYLKKFHTVKKIGYLPKKIFGEVFNSGWGENSIIRGKWAYFIGYKYFKNNPIDIKISRVSLSQIEQINLMDEDK